MRGKTSRKLRKLAYQRAVLVAGQPDYVQVHKGQLVRAVFGFVKHLFDDDGKHTGDVTQVVKKDYLGTVRCTGFRRSYQALKRQLKEVRRQPVNGRCRTLEELL